MVHPDREPPGIFPGEGQGLLVGVVRRQAALGVQVVLPWPADQLGDAGAALPQRGGHTVAGGVAGPHDHHMPPLRRGDGGGQPEGLPLYGGPEIFRAVVYAGDAIGIHPQRPGRSRATAEEDRVILGQQPPGGSGNCGVHTGDEADALVDHQLDPPLHHRFRELHIGDAVGQQSSGVGVPFHHGDGVPPVVELIRRRKAGRTGPHHRNFFTGILGRSVPPYRLPGKGLLNNSQLIFPDGHRVAVYAADTGSLAGGRTDPAGKFRKVVGFQQPLQGVGGISGVDHVVPLRNQVVERTAEGSALVEEARLAEGHAAVHASPSLLTALPVGEGEMKLLPVLYPLQRRAAAGVPAGIFQKSRRFSHFSRPPFSFRRWSRRR